MLHGRHAYRNTSRPPCSSLTHFRLPFSPPRLPRARFLAPSLSRPFPSRPLPTHPPFPPHPQECKGDGICKCGKVKSKCTDCKGSDPKAGSAMCAHGRQRYRCKECKGSGICEHGRHKYNCKVRDEWKTSGRGEEDGEEDGMTATCTLLVYMNVLVHLV